MHVLPFHCAFIQVKKCIPLRPRAWAEIKAMYICGRRDRRRREKREMIQKGQQCGCYMCLFYFCCDKNINLKELFF